MPPRYARIAFFVVVGLTLCGCASLPPGSKRDPRDPWERMNRATYKFNDGLDRAIAKPVAKAYVKVTPRFVQTGVSNFFDNVAYPITIVNDLLQGKIKQTCQDTGRLVVNTTIGIGGLFDPASKMGFDKNDEDFGQTLGKWGVHPGPYLVIPFFGFSDVRDGIGRGVGIFANPTHYVRDATLRWSLWGLDLLDSRARVLSAGDVLNQTFDPYTFSRNAYLQRRQYLVTDGEDSGVEEPPPDVPDDTDSGGTGTDQKAPTPPQDTDKK
jgi:phospholipid-binding lipoprotein MlaA